jgi:hypothetical protein
MSLSKEVFDRDHAIFKTLPTGEKDCRFNPSTLERIIKNLVNAKFINEAATIAEVGGGDNDKPCSKFVVATTIPVT